MPDSLTWATAQAFRFALGPRQAQPVGIGKARYRGRIKAHPALPACAHVGCILGRAGRVGHRLRGLVGGPATGCFGLTRAAQPWSSLHRCLSLCPARCLSSELSGNRGHSKGLGRSRRISSAQAHLEPRGTQRTYVRNVLLQCLHKKPCMCNKNFRSYDSLLKA